MWHRKPPPGVPLRGDSHWSVDGLVGFWPMQMGAGLQARDLSGNNNHGALIGMAVESSTSGWTAGRNGTAIAFDGGNDRINIGDNLDMGVSSFTIVFWANAVDWSASTEYFMSKMDASRGYRFTLAGLGDLGKLRLQMDDGGVAGTYLSTVVADIPNGEWGHIGLTVDRGVDLATFYVNGQQLGNVVDISATTGNIDSAPDFMIGANPVNPASANNFEGKMDSFLFYRRALSAAEVMELFIDPYIQFKPEMDIALLAQIAGVSMPIIMQQYSHLNGGAAPWV